MLWLTVILGSVQSYIEAKCSLMKNQTWVKMASNPNSSSELAYMTEKEEPEVFIPEVLPREDSEERQEPFRNRSRLVLAGLFIDLVDFVLRGPLGLRLGFPVGCMVGIVLGRYLGLPWTKTLILAFVAGLYCTLPGTAVLPLGTLVALLGKTSWLGKRR